MKKRSNEAKLKIVTNTPEPTIPSVSSQPTQGYGVKPWTPLSGYIDRRSSYLIEQAQSLVRRDFTADEAVLLFQYVDLNTREAFPETDLAASRQPTCARPFWVRWFGGEGSVPAEEV